MAILLLLSEAFIAETASKRWKRILIFRKIWSLILWEIFIFRTLPIMLLEKLISPVSCQPWPEPAPLAIRTEQWLQRNFLRQKGWRLMLRAIFTYQTAAMTKLRRFPMESFLRLFHPA